jgi:thiamine biosynthesis protein ThiS
MEIKLNGEKRLYDGPATVLGLLESLGLRPGTVVVEVNRRAVPRDQMEKETIGEGDAVELVRLVRGG